MTYTGETRRLHEEEITDKPAAKYTYEDGDGVWIVYRNTRARLPHKRARLPREDHETPTAIPVQAHATAPREQLHVKVTRQPYTDVNPITDALMPFLAILVTLLAIVTVGGYQTVPGWAIPVCILALLAYTLYRANPMYEQNGRAFEKLMRATHNDNGKINLKRTAQVLRNQVEIVEEE